MGGITGAAKYFVKFGYGFTQSFCEETKLCFNMNTENPMADAQSIFEHVGSFADEWRDEELRRVQPGSPYFKDEHAKCHSNMECRKRVGSDHRRWKKLHEAGKLLTPKIKIPMGDSRSNISQGNPLDDAQDEIDLEAE
jgi:hypothetical protein